MRKKYTISLKNDLTGIFACLLAFFIPVFPKLVPLLIVFMIVSAFLQPKKLHFHPSFRLFAFLFTAFYSCYLLGMFYSVNTKEGLFDLEVKLSFLVIPLFFLFHGPFKLHWLRGLFAFYVTGCFVAGITSLYYGWRCYSETGTTDCFYSSNITQFIHGSYLAVYFCLAILIVVHSFINYYSRMKVSFRIVNLFLLFYFSVLVLLLSSKGGLLALVLVIIVSTAYYFYKAGKIKNILLAMAALSVVFVIFFSFSSYVRMRFATIFETSRLSEEELFATHHNSTESSAVRLMIWTVAKELISDHPMGVGTGSNKDHLLQKYRDRDMNGAYDLKLNCHNQYLETTLSVGFHGLIMLVALLFYGMYYAVRKKNFLLLWVIAIVALNLFFESFFERQAGIVFFVFFAWVLYTSVPEIVPVGKVKHRSS